MNTASSLIQITACKKCFLSWGRKKQEFVSKAIAVKRQSLFQNIQGQNRNYAIDLVKFVSATKEKKDKGSWALQEIKTLTKVRQKV